jgi:aspartyl-tRNA(Asn)/glutamyl-tRNA(Gln) amidotransferase subunit A
MDNVFFYRNPKDDAPRNGPLSGLRIAVQSAISVAGWPTDAGSPALTDFVALENATVVDRLREAGAVLCGSTRPSEFGFGLRGSKAGVAVHERSADVELVLDMMGESRLAASRAAVCGFKPSYGLVSRYGLVGLVPSMEACGLLSGNLHDIRETLRAVAGPDERDFSLPDEKSPDFSLSEIDPRETTVGVIREVLSALPAAEEKMLRSSVDEVGKAGFSVRECSFPEFPLFQLVVKIVGSVEASSSAGRYDSVRYGQRARGAKNWNDMYLLSRGAAFGPLLKSCLFQGAFFQFERYDAYEDACRIRARLVKEMQRVASQADFLVCPTVNPCGSDAPASLAETYAQFIYTAFANVTGQPALHLPQSSGALQPGLQIVGPRLSDARLLALGEYLLRIGQGGK